MYSDMKQLYWCPGLKCDIVKFIAQCFIFQQVKDKHQRPGGKLQPISIPEWKWENITMDFVSGLPKSLGGNDIVWVIFDRLKKSAHFLPIRTTFIMDKLASLYVKEIVRLHRVSVSIVLDRDTRFTSNFLRSLQNALRTQLNFSTAFHLQTNGQSKRIIQILKDMLRTCVLDFGGSWEDHMPLVEFSHNNNFQTSIRMTPYEALYGRKCRSTICWDDVGERKLFGFGLSNYRKDLTNTRKVENSTKLA